MNIIVYKKFIFYIFVSLFVIELIINFFIIIFLGINGCFIIVCIVFFIDFFVFLKLFSYVLKFIL